MSDRDPRAVASAAYVTISTSPCSTEATIALVRLLADAHGSATLDLAADRLAGIAAKPGARRLDDAAALARISELRPSLRTGAVAFVARQLYPGDARAQAAAAKRWRRKLAE